MIIKELRIKSFGKIKDKNIRLDDGINVIFGKNESGKTTIITFIRFMLFGGQGRNNPVKNYFPLDLSEPAGEIVISDSSGEYLIVRNGVKKKGSYAVVTCLSDGQILTGEKAEKFISDTVGMSEDMFSSTIYVKDISESTLLAKDEIIRRLDNLSSSGDELVNFKKVTEALEEEKLSLVSPKRKGALIPALTSRLEEVGRDIYSLREKISPKKELEIQLNEISAREKMLTQQGTDEEERALYELNKSFNELNVQISEAEKMVPAEYMAVNKEDTEAALRAEKVLKSSVIYYLGGLLFIACIISFFASFIPFVITALSVFCVCGMLIRKFYANKQLKGILERYGAQDCKDLIYRIDFYSSKLEELVQLKKKRDSISEKISKLSLDRENKKKILAENMRRTVETVTRKNRIEAELESIFAYEKELDEKEALYKEIKESLEKYSEYVKIINDTAELITIAYEKLKKDFSPVVSDAAAKVFSCMTENTDERIIVSDELQLSLVRGDRVYSLCNLSRSTLDLIYFSFRMAVIQSLAGKENVLIMDEAFIRYDSMRLKSVFAYLGSTSYQIIMASFSEYEIDFIEKECNVNIIKL